MSLGQYVITSQIIPPCCTTIVKEMIFFAIRTSNIAYNTLQKLSNREYSTSNNTKKDIKDNNIVLIASLKSLCEILKEHNKRFTRNSSELNLAVGTAVHSIEQIEVHTPIINAVNNLLNSLETLPSFSGIRFSLMQALETSVIQSIIIAICFKSS